MSLDEEGTSDHYQQKTFLLNQSDQDINRLKHLHERLEESCLSEQQNQSRIEDISTFPINQAHKKKNQNDIQYQCQTELSSNNQNMVYNKNKQGINKSLSQSYIQSRNKLEELEIISRSPTQRVTNQQFKNLQRRVNLDLEYYYKKNFKKKQIENQLVLSKISQHLNEQILREYYGITISKISFLSQNFSVQTINELCLTMEEVQYLPNQIIYDENDHDDFSLIYIQSGEVELIQLNTKDNNHQIDTIKQDSILGQENFFTGTLRSCRVRSKTFTSVVKISRNKFIEIIKNNEIDYEKFMFIKDQIFLYQNYHSIKISCYICNKFSHFTRDCPLVHFDKNESYNKMGYLQKVKQQRSPFDRNKQKTQNALLIINNINYATQQLISNPIYDIFEKQNEVNEISIESQCCEEEQSEELSQESQEIQKSDENILSKDLSPTVNKNQALFKQYDEKELVQDEQDQQIVQNKDSLQQNQFIFPPFELRKSQSKENQLKPLQIQQSASEELNLDTKQKKQNEKSQTSYGSLKNISKLDMFQQQSQLEPVSSPLAMQPSSKRATSRIQKRNSTYFAENRRNAVRLQTVMQFKSILDIEDNNHRFKKDQILWNFDIQKDYQIYFPEVEDNQIIQQFKQLIIMDFEFQDIQPFKNKLFEQEDQDQQNLRQLFDRKEESCNLDQSLLSSNSRNFAQSIEQTNDQHQFQQTSFVNNEDGHLYSNNQINVLKKSQIEIPQQNIYEIQNNLDDKEYAVDNKQSLQKIQDVSQNSSFQNHYIEKINSKELKNSSFDLSKRKFQMGSNRNMDAHPSSHRKNHTNLLKQNNEINFVLKIKNRLIEFYQNNTDLGRRSLLKNRNIRQSINDKSDFLEEQIQNKIKISINRFISLLKKFKTKVIQSIPLFNPQNPLIFALQIIFCLINCFYFLFYSTILTFGVKELQSVQIIYFIITAWILEVIVKINTAIYINTDLVKDRSVILGIYFKQSLLYDIIPIISLLNRFDNYALQIILTIATFIKLKNVINELLEIQKQLCMEIKNYFYVQIFNLENEDVLGRISQTLNDQLQVEYFKEIIKKYSSLSNNFSEGSIEKLCLSMVEENYIPNQIIFQENDTENLGILIILEGSIEMTKRVSQSQDVSKTLSILGKGQSTGLMSFFTGQLRTATARSKSFTTIIRIQRDEFIKIIKENETDFQQFNFIKDKIQIYGNYEDIRIQCSLCKKFTHYTSDCPLVHFNKQQYQNKLNYFEKIQQKRQFMQRKSYYYHSRVMIQKLKECSEQFEFLQRMKSSQNQDQNSDNSSSDASEKSIDKQIEQNTKFEELTQLEKQFTQTVEQKKQSSLSKIQIDLGNSQNNIQCECQDSEQTKVKASTVIFKQRSNQLFETNSSRNIKNFGAEEYGKRPTQTQFILKQRKVQDNLELEVQCVQSYSMYDNPWIYDKQKDFSIYFPDGNLKLSLCKNNLYNQDLMINDLDDNSITRFEAYKNDFLNLGIDFEQNKLKNLHFRKEESFQSEKSSKIFLDEVVEQINQPNQNLSMMGEVSNAISCSKNNLFQNDKEQNSLDQQEIQVDMSDLKSEIKSNLKKDFLERSSNPNILTTFGQKLQLNNQQQNSKIIQQETWMSNHKAYCSNNINTNQTKYQMTISGRTNYLKISKLRNILNDLSDLRDQKRRTDIAVDREKIMANYIKNNALNDLISNLQRRVNIDLEYFYQKNYKKISEENEQVLAKISTHLNEQIHREYYGRILNKIQYISKYFSEQTLNKILDCIEELYYLPNQIIFREDQNSDFSLMYIAEGSVELSRQVSAESQISKTLAVLGQECIFGQHSFFTGHVRGACAKSKAFTTIIKISRDKFLNIIQQNEKDYEQFCQIKDDIMIYRNYEKIQIKCFICNQFNHYSSDCPMAHFDREEFYSNMSFYQKIEQFRKYKERSKKKKINTLLILQQVKDASNQMVQIEFKEFIEEVGKLKDYPVTELDTDDENESEFQSKIKSKEEFVSKQRNSVLVQSMNELQDIQEAKKSQKFIQEAKSKLQACGKDEFCQNQERQENQRSSFNNILDSYQAQDMKVSAINKGSMKRIDQGEHNVYQSVDRWNINQRIFQDIKQDCLIYFDKAKEYQIYYPNGNYRILISKYNRAMKKFQKKKKLNKKN
ncbi:hypothetical protein ABPG73_010396 [Tetrahymena malaccensis]